MEKVTYATLDALGDDFHQGFETAVRHVQKKLGHAHPLFIAGQKKKLSSRTFADCNPADKRMTLGTFQQAGPADVRKAIAAAKASADDWRELGWPQRIAFLRKAAELMAHRRFDLAAILSLETGKNRFEAFAEVCESVALVQYYCGEMERNNGYETSMGRYSREQARSVLKPYGAWGVISPFNFPLALSTGAAAAALLAGNTVIFKPASDAPLAGLCLYDILHDAGLPVGASQFLTGPGKEIGEEFCANPDLGGLAFIGSKEVGLALLRRFALYTWPRPCLAEMGGKNPAIIMPSAHLENAAEGVLRSAFGLGGQKCSACSRVYVHKQIGAAFVDCLVEKTRACKIGNPIDRDTFLGPLINEQAVRRFDRAVRLARKDGRILWGGNKLTQSDFANGFYVEPTVVDQVSRKSALFHDELFVPLVVVSEFKTLEEAIGLANDSEFGLSAGIFTRSESEQERFFECVQAGVLYANRAAGATTGAWPGMQSFGGWKASGATGRNALGPHYLPQFMREQSQTVTYQ